MPPQGPLCIICHEYGVTTALGGGTCQCGGVCDDCATLFTPCGGCGCGTGSPSPCRIMYRRCPKCRADVVLQTLQKS
jgi:hypothetical protein